MGKISEWAQRKDKHAPKRENLSELKITKTIVCFQTQDNKNEVENKTNKLQQKLKIGFG